MRPVLSLLCLLSLTCALRAQEPLVVKVKTSIHKGVDALIRMQRADGSWDNTRDDDKTDFNGGATGLAVLALLNCDDIFAPDDPLEKRRLKAIHDGINNLRRIKGVTVYARALQTMALAEAKVETEIIKDNVQWLIKARVFHDGKFVGWDYYNNPEAVATDASNSQYAMLALWYARQVPGIEIPREVWQSIHDYYRRTQNEKGYWGYSSFYGAKLSAPSVTMTIAGLCGLSIAGGELGRGGKCGVYPDDDALARGLRWFHGDAVRKIPSRFTLEIDRLQYYNSATYYHLYGLERAGRLSGLRFFGEHDWYREGCEFLVKKQAIDGSWPEGAGHDRWPHVNTAFALLFLSKGRTPVVISKLVHGNWSEGRVEWDNDWNNDRNDLRHLTEHIAREGSLFGKKPLAWQTYDIMRALYARSPRPGAKEDDEIIADMRQSPILYFNGHKSPLRRFQDRENTLIKRFLENGGFLVAEACCGSKDFDDGIKEWVKELWPGSELMNLESTHPIWTAHHTINAGDPFKLMGLQVGCRTVMIYSPQDLSCHWEANQPTRGVSKRAFELGENLIAYGTGKIRPQPRLTPIEIAGERKPASKPNKRGYLQAGQLVVNRENFPAPQAMNNLLEHVHKVAGIDVFLRTDAITFGQPNDLLRTKLLYMHGRKEFDVKSDQLETLRFNLENGGLLFADACCGNTDFDRSFRRFVQDLFPKEKLVVLSTDPQSRDPVYGEKLNGAAITSVKCRTKPNGALQEMPPHLEGIRVNGRWVVLYSKYDIGCALERNSSPDCVGYDHASALKLATVAVLYHVRP